jgi:DNA-binding transcriptional MerR regulator
MASYGIKELETLTGIKAHTIRIWEKRYGIISPNRTQKQIRKYNDQELISLLNISLLTKNGIKISRIATMGLEKINQLVWELKSDTKIDNAEEKLILALLELNEELFKTTLQKLITHKGLEGTFSTTLIPFLNRIGTMYLVGTINPAQEHFISNLIRQLLIAEIDKLAIPTAKQPIVMLYLPEHEWHEISLLFYHYALRSKNISTIYLGQSLPYDSLLKCIRQIHPKMLVTSWLTAVDETFIVPYFKHLKSEFPDLNIFAGGQQINLFSSLLADYLTEIKHIDSLTSECMTEAAKIN